MSDEKRDALFNNDTSERTGGRSYYRPRQNTGNHPDPLADLERDAARWRAVVNCAQIKMQGWAGCDANGDRMPLAQRPVGSVHFGAEFWSAGSGHDQLPSQATTIEAGRKVLIAFADDCIAAQALAKAQP